MKKQKREREGREAPAFVKRTTDYIDSAWPVRMGRRVDDYFSALDDAYMKRKGGTSLFGLWGSIIGHAVTVISFVVLGLWLLVELGIL